jgi:hypothetical protein
VSSLQGRHLPCVTLDGLCPRSDGSRWHEIIFLLMGLRVGRSPGAPPDDVESLGTIDKDNARDGWILPLKEARS